MNFPARQRGLSLIGFLFLGALILAVAFVVFRATPSYIEYFSVKKVLAATLSRVSTGATPAQIRYEFDKIASAEYIDSVTGRDVDVGKEGGKLVLTAAWNKKIKLVGNASLLLEFEATTNK